MEVVSIKMIRHVFKTVKFWFVQNFFRILTKIVKTICSLNPLQVLSCTEERTLGREGMEKGGRGGGVVNLMFSQVLAFTSI